MKLSVMSYFRSGGVIRIKLDVCLPELSAVVDDLKAIIEQHGDIQVESASIVLDGVAAK